MKDVWTTGCALLLMLAAAQTTWAQQGRIGMDEDALTERVGLPHAREAVADDLSLWHYPGEDGQTHFGYLLADGRVEGTTALVPHATQMAAEIGLARVVGTLKDRGWAAERRSPHHYVLEAGDSRYVAELLAGRADHAVLLVHLHRSRAQRYADLRTRVADRHPADRPDTAYRPLLSAFAPDAARPSEPETASPPAAPVRRVAAASAVPEAAVPEAAGREDAGREVAALDAAAPIVPGRGGLTWVVASHRGRADAEAERARYAAAGAAVAVLAARAGDTDLFRVAVGQYPTLDAAQAARPSLPRFAPADSWPLRLTADLRVVAPPSADAYAQR